MIGSFREFVYAPTPEPNPAEAWRLEALCAQAGPDAWFPEKGQAVRKVQDICRRCPAVDACLEYALDNEIRYGIWGAASQNERAKMLKARKKAALQDRLHGGEAA